VIDEYERRIRELLPRADVSLTGSASVPDLEADDYDLVVLVDDVAGAAAILAEDYPPLYPEEWRDDWAAFRNAGPPQVDIVLTREGTGGDKHHRLAWRLLAEDPALLAEYRELKASPRDYERRKRDFFDRVVALL
jgi:GrpB-like predicted nucleotidyltransferase (UPF0157 family)